MLIGYARDAVRLFNARTVSLAVELSYQSDVTASGKYPKNLEDLIGEGKLLSEYPKDPVSAVDLAALNATLKSLGVPDSVIDTDVSEANGYKFVYGTDDSRSQYELSTKLESVFLSKRMQEDGGNDPHRYELGSNLKINTALKGSSVRSAEASGDRSKSYEQMKSFVESFKKMDEAVLEPQKTRRTNR
jgi:hypothetical protein